MNSRLDIYEQGERTNDAENAFLIHQRNAAYLIAAVAALIAMLAVGAVALMVPLKQEVPWIIRENTITGEFSYPERITEANYRSVDATTYKFVYEYLRARERFNMVTLESDIDHVYLLSSEDHANNNYQDFLDSDPHSPMRLGRNDSRKFSIRALIPLQDGLMQARFTTTDVINGRKEKPKLWIATMRYSYSPNNVPTDTENKYLNPVGFMVTDYSRDPEIIQGAR